MKRCCKDSERAHAYWLLIEENILDTDDNGIESSSINGNSKGGTSPVPPSNLMYVPQINQQEPLFKSVDNPGSWYIFIFCPKFKKKSTKAYTPHEIQADTVVLPVDPMSGKHVQGEYEFFYNGWTHPNPSIDNCCFRTTKDNLFPNYRKTTFDAQLLNNGVGKGENAEARCFILLSTSLSVLWSLKFWY